MQQVHVYYSGRVQGVGFRFTAEDIAHELGVTGWVKNLGDGRVEIVAQAEEFALKKFLSRLNDYFGSYIRETDAQWEEASGQFKDFNIAF